MALGSLRTALLVAAFGLLATGCLGGSHAASTVSSTTKPPQTRLTVSYTEGYGHRLGACPRGAVCTTSVMRGSNVRVARFRLRCDPPAGTYPDPYAACAAAESYIRLRSRPPDSVCRCPAEVYRNAITGTFTDSA